MKSHLTFSELIYNLLSTGVETLTTSGTPHPKDKRFFCAHRFSIIDARLCREGEEYNTLTGNNSSLLVEAFEPLDTLQRVNFEKYNKEAYYA